MHGNDKDRDAWRRVVKASEDDADAPNLMSIAGWLDRRLDQSTSDRVERWLAHSKNARAYLEDFEERSAAPPHLRKRAKGLVRSASSSPAPPAWLLGRLLPRLLTPPLAAAAFSAVVAAAVGLFLGFEAYHDQRTVEIAMQKAAAFDVADRRRGG